MGRDRVSQIKAVFNYRKKEIKNRKKIQVLAISLIIMITATCGIYVYAKGTVNSYNAKAETLYSGLNDLESQKNEIESQKQELENQKEELLSTAELMAKNNQSLIESNINLQNTVLKAAATGITPQNYDLSENADSAVDYSKLEYLGEFEGTAYTPSVDETSGTGLTASGKVIVPGVSIAVDTNYWSLGTKFYIEGLGYVEAMDTGSAVKGRERFDYAVFDKDFAKQLGRRKWKVYLVTEE